MPLGFGGERGIRTPGTLQFNGFQDRRIRPLCHFSAAKIRSFSDTSMLSEKNKKINFFCIDKYLKISYIYI